MSFKKGDKMLSLEDNHYGRRFKGKIYEITKVPFDTPYYKAETGGEFAVGRMDSITEVVLDNPLNKKLYPDRQSWNGYLVPRKAAAKLSEEKDQRE